MENPDSAVDVIRNLYCLECPDRDAFFEENGECCLCGDDPHHETAEGCTEKEILARRRAWADTHMVNSPLYNWPPCMKLA